MMLGRTALRRGSLPEPTHGQRADLCNSLVVVVDVDHSGPMVQGRFGDQQVGDRRSMPHPMVVREVVLERERAFQHVRRCRNDLEAVMQCSLELVVVA
jgi:hypothetical protein